MKHHGSRVARCELLEAGRYPTVPHLDELGKMLYKPVTAAEMAAKRSKDVADIAEKTKKAKKAKEGSRLGRGARNAISAAVGIPAGAALVAGGDIEESSRPEPMKRKKPRKEKDDGEIGMTRSKFKREHKHLLKVLSRCKTAAAKQEYMSQKSEMKDELRNKKD